MQAVDLGLDGCGLGCRAAGIQLVLARGQREHEGCALGLRDSLLLGHRDMMTDPTARATAKRFHANACETLQSERIVGSAGTVIELKAWVPRSSLTDRGETRNRNQIACQQARAFEVEL